MAFHHRKLIFESLDNSTGKTCSSYYCNAKENPSEICPLSCLYICYPICSFPLFSEIQPPLPPNFFTPKIPLPQSPHKPTISIFLIILFSVLATSFFIFCCFVVYKFRNSRILSQRQQQVEDEEEEEFSDMVDEDIYGPMVDHPIWYIRTVGLQPSVISAITICKYKRGEGLIEGTDCSVCLSEFQEDETLRILPKCNHAFHIPCIDTWLRIHTNCPLCRTGIVIATTAPSPSPEQNLGVRHDEETRSENATELRIEIENAADISSMDISGNSKEDVGNGNGGELGEFYASRIPASSESLSTAFMTSGASADANEQSTDQNSSEESIEVNDSNFDVNESSTEKRNFCVDRVMEKEQMRSLSFSTR